MSNKWLCSLSILLLLSFSACNLAKSMTEGETPSDPAADQQTQVALAVQQTQVALAVQQTQAAGAPGLPLPTLTPEAVIVTVTVSVETNCRTGPGEPYAILGVLPVGVPAEVIGRNASGDTWIIKLPSNPAITCWLWGYYASVTGETASLTVYTPPPTPTPSAAFTISYTYTIDCGPMIFALRYQLLNTGSVTFSSYRLVTYDSTWSMAYENASDDFKNYTTCADPVNVLQDLEPGESGIAGNWTDTFEYDPAGHSFTATFTLCSEDGLAGLCVDKSITVTP